MKKSFILISLMAAVIASAFAQQSTQYNSKQNAVTAFTLFDQKKNKDLRVLTNGVEIELSQLCDPHITIRAATNPTSVGSVVLYIDGIKKAVENYTPYTFGTELPNELLEVGFHSLKAVPYSKPNGKGDAGKSLSISIKVIGQRVSRLTLIDANTNKDLCKLSDGDTLFPVAYQSKLNIRASTTPKHVGSVVIVLDGKFKSTDNNYPYTFDKKLPDDFLRRGKHTVIATPYSKAGGKGSTGQQLAVTLYMDTYRIDQLILFDSATGKDIKSLKGKDTIDVSAFPTSVFNVRALTTPKDPGSVVIELDSKWKATENHAPFTFGNRLPTTFLVPGDHTISVTPYTKPNGKGNRGEKTKVHLFIPEPGDDDESENESSLGVLQLVNANDTSFNAASAGLIFTLSGAEFQNDPKRHFLKVNGQNVSLPSILIEPNKLTLPLVLAPGFNEIEYFGFDSKDYAISGTYSLWMGNNKLPITVVNAQGIPVANAVVDVVLGDNTEVKATGLTNGTGQITFDNIPVRTLVVTATGSDNQFATAGIVGFGLPLTMHLEGFATPSAIDNNDFNLGLQGWNIGTAPVQLIPHIEDAGAKNNATLATDMDLQLSTSGQGPKSISRTFSVGSTQGGGGVRVRYRFVTSEVPGGYYGSQYNDYYSVAIRNQLTGDIKSEGKAMNSFNLWDYDASGGIAWREITLPASVGDVIQVDATVANVADGLLNSQVIVDFIDGSVFEITKATIKDIDNTNLDFLSMDTHGYFDGNTRVSGSITLKGEAEAKLKKVELEVRRNNEIIARGALNPDLVANAYTTFGEDKTITISNTSFLFQIPAPAQALSAGDLQLKVAAELETGEKKSLDVKSVKVLTKFEWANRFSGRDSALGGDDWGEPTVVDFIESSIPSTFYLNDLSNMNAGHFPQHAEHRTGQDLDCRLTRLKPNPERMNTVEIATAILDLLHSDAGARIERVLVTYQEVNTDPFWNAIKDDPDAGKIQIASGHSDHFHLDITKSTVSNLMLSEPGFYIAPSREALVQRGVAKDSSHQQIVSAAPAIETSTNVFPNPAKVGVTQLRVTGYDEKIKGATVQLHDFAGRLLYHGTINSFSNTTIINLPSGLGLKGLYILTIRSETGVQTKKIFVE